MFAEEIDAKIRTYSTPPMNQKELKRMKEIERRAAKDAQYLWEKLQNLFESNVPFFAKDAYGRAYINFKFKNKNFICNSHHIYYSIGYRPNEYMLLSPKWIMYPLKALEILSKIASDNGLDVRHDRIVISFSNNFFEEHYQFLIPATKS